MPETTEHIRCTVIYSGTVQGVGFRYTVRSLSRSFEVSGYVRNLPDGRVELVAEGRPAELERFRQAIAQAMSGYIRDAACSEGPASGEFSGFSIRF